MNKLSVSCFFVFVFCLFFTIIVVVVVVARCYLLMLLFVCVCVVVVVAVVVVVHCCCRVCFCGFSLLLLFCGGGGVTKLDPVPLGLMFFCTISPEAFLSANCTSGSATAHGLLTLSSEAWLPVAAIFACLSLFTKPCSLLLSSPH